VIAPGTEAFIVVQQESGSRSRSGNRAKLVGAARVRIIDFRGETYRVEVIAGSGVSEGFPLEATREELFVTPAERKYFKQLVDWLWGGIPRTMERPPIDDE
jgi:hypothetical protein